MMFYFSLSPSLFPGRSRERDRYEEAPVSDAAAGGDLFAVGLVTPPALVTACRGLLRRAGSADTAGRSQALFELQ